jgi:putative membrane protein
MAPQRDLDDPGTIRARSTMPRTGTISFRGWLLGLLAAAFLISAYQPHNPQDFILEHTLTAAFIAFIVLIERRQARISAVGSAAAVAPGAGHRSRNPGRVHDRAWVFSSMACACMFLYLILHVLGAHYTYSLVPYDEWSRIVLGWFDTGAMVTDGPAAGAGAMPAAAVVEPLSGHAAAGPRGGGMSINSLFGWERNHYDRLVHALFGVLMLLPCAELLEWSARLPRRWAVPLAISVLAALSHLYELIEWLFAITLSPEAAEAYNGQQGDPFDAQKDMALAFVGSLLSAMAVMMQARWTMRRQPARLR